MSLEERIAKIEGIVEQMDKRLSNIENRLNHVETEISNIRTEISNIRNEILNVRTAIESEIRSLFKWTVGLILGMWVTVIMTLIPILLKILGVI